MEKLPVDTLKKIATNRKIYIWGAMIVGQGVCRALERVGIPVSGFVDHSMALQGRTALGYPIYSPDIALKKSQQKDGLIIIGSGHYDLDIADECNAVGLQKDKDYIFCRQLNDLDPSVDVSGVCNLRCISCPRGNMPLVSGGFMTSDVYQQVLQKLLREIPFLGNIQLYAWGEPLLNRDLPAIIQLTRQAKILVAISTNLNIRKDFSEAIKAKPDWLKISTSGFGENYEITHTGGNWDLFYKNLNLLADLRATYYPRMQIMVNYHLYKHNIGEDYQKIKWLCNKLDFIFRPNYAYLYPLDNVMAYRHGKPLSDEAKATMDLLLLDIDQGIVRAEAQKELPCPEERCFPISWDLKIRHCGVYFNPFIANNFLETSVEEIIEKRLQSKLCARCKSLGLHRYTGVYLEEKLLETI